MKPTIFNLHKLSEAELGQFSVLLSAALNEKQVGALLDLMPQLEIMSGHEIATAAGITIGHPLVLRAKTLFEMGKEIEAIKELRKSTGLSLKDSKHFVDSMVQQGKWKRKR